MQRLAELVGLLPPVVLLVAAALLLGCIVRVMVTVWPPPGVKLPHPSKVPGLPMAGPASPAAAHAAIMRRPARRSWKFWT